MTLHSPPQVSAPARGPRRNLLGGLAALLLLAVIVVVPPVGLTVAVGNPMPAHAVVGGRLTDDAVIGMLAAVVWLAWAQMLLAILAEAAAALRGCGLFRRVPLCGPQQLFARRLIVAVTFLLAGSTAGTSSFAGTAAAGTVATACLPANPGPAVGEPAVRNAHVVLPAPSTSVARSSAGSVADLLSVERTVVPPIPEAALWYTVQPPHGRHHDTLWDIAERHLGDGLRWKDIYRLNEHRLQPDGERLEVASLIRPGWRLLLPADAVGIRSDSETSSEAESSAGDGARHGHAAAAEDDAAASSSGHVRQGAVAQPAAERGTDHHSGTGHRPPRPAIRPATAADAVVPSARTAPGAAEARSTKPATGQSQAIRSDAAASNVRGTLTDRQDRSSDAHDVDDDEPGIPFGALTLGLTALAAAGLTAELARRRRRARRFRLPGDRLTAPDRAQTLVERQLRTANAEITVTVLRNALRELAAACRRGDRALPDVHAVLLNADTITLHLGSDDPVAVGPFIATGPRTWTLDGAPSAEAEAEGHPDDFLDPYPALVSVGVTDDAVVLVNLEAAGTLHIDGPVEAATEIACAIAAELGTSALSATTELILSGLPQPLTAITDPGRTEPERAELAAKSAVARLQDVGAALRASGLRDLADARSRRKASDLWAPAVLVDVATVVPEVPDALAVVAPYSGLSLVTNRPNPTGTGWSLRAGDDHWRLEPLGLDVDPQRIPVARLATVAGLLNVTSVRPVSSADSRPDDRNLPDGGAQSTAFSTVFVDVPADPTDLAVIASAIPQPSPPIGPDVDSPAGPPATVAPRVLVLGPVEVTGAAGDGVPGRRRRGTELITYLALHPGASAHQIDEALWPGLRVSAETRNPLVCRARRWLGKGDDKQPYLAFVPEDGLYTLRPEVRTDWHDFCDLSRRGLAAGPDGIDDLVRALDLVRGRPFLGVHPDTYAWAEVDMQDMIDAIVDVARVLAGLAHEAGDPRRARWASAKGLVVDSCAERLYQDAIRAAQCLGDELDATRLVATLRREVMDLDPDDDCEPRTAELHVAALGVRDVDGFRRGS